VKVLEVPVGVEVARYGSATRANKGKQRKTRWCYDEIVTVSFVPLIVTKTMLKLNLLL